MITDLATAMAVTPDCEPAANEPQITIMGSDVTTSLAFTPNCESVVDSPQVTNLVPNFTTSLAVTTNHESTVNQPQIIIMGTDLATSLAFTPNCESVVNGPQVAITGANVTNYSPPPSPSSLPQNDSPASPPQHSPVQQTFHNGEEEVEGFWSGPLFTHTAADSDEVLKTMRKMWTLKARTTARAECGFASP
jgi:hypothetical protein